MRNQGSGSLKRLSELQMGHFKVILDQYVTPKLESWTYSIFCDIFTSCGHFWAIFEASEVILDPVHNMLCNEEWNDLSKIFRQNYYGGASVCSISDFFARSSWFFKRRTRQIFVKGSPFQETQRRDGQCICIGCTGNAI